MYRSDDRQLVSPSVLWNRRRLVAFVGGLALLAWLETASAQMGPDLTISSGALTATPSTVAQGGSVQLSAWTVRNQGSAASGFFSNGFYLSSDPVITSSDTYLTETRTTAWPRPRRSTGEARP